MPNIYLIIFLFSKDSINISNKKISIDINIFIHFQLYFYPLMFYRMGRYCLPDSCFLFILNPETSSRDYKHDEDGCLEDSTLEALSPSAPSPCSKSITDNADATDLFFSRICLFYYDLSAPTGRYDCHGLSLDGGYPAPYRRKYNP